MRLLHTTTLKLHEFFGSNIPPYYILSHRWEGSEITYQDVRDGTNTEAFGWSKVRSACAFARAQDLKLKEDTGEEVSFLWIDTCCIDKTSSSELTEAVNSMFGWYQRAEICLAYLKDVASELGPAARDEAILKSEWFKRGWTLQELLAPEELVFISSDWSEVLGSRFYFSEVIFRATGIQNDDFWELRGGGVSVARRISWASRRTCTREEDEAYCLMGLLGVNMPLLYGEGKNAFKRLQQELLKESDDESIFAWWVSLENQTGSHTGLLASSPHDFRYSSWVHPFPIDRNARPYSMTNKGLQLEVSLLEISRLVITERYHVGTDGTIVTRERFEAVSLGPKGQICAIALNCFLKRSPLKDNIDRSSLDTRPSPIIIILDRVTESSNTYLRTLVHEIEMRPSPFREISSRQSIFVKEPGVSLSTYYPRRSKQTSSESMLQLPPRTW